MMFWFMAHLVQEGLPALRRQILQDESRAEALEEVVAGRASAVAGGVAAAGNAAGRGAVVDVETERERENADFENRTSLWWGQHEILGKYSVGILFLSRSVKRADENKQAIQESGW